MSTDNTIELEQFLESMSPPHDDIQQEMSEHASREGFPIIGRTVGGLLHQLVTMKEADRVFEFGSGFGYSAYWFARALPESGQVVLTEEDEEELDKAREYFARAGLTHLARFEEGDALDVIDRYHGPFDIVLIDHDKQRYRDAFERIRDRLPPGGVIVADNAISAGPMDTEGLMRAIIEGEGAADLDDMTDGVRRYLEVVRDDAAFTTVVLPIGSGIALSVRHRG